MKILFKLPALVVSVLATGPAIAVDEADFASRITGKTVTIEHPKKGITFQRYFGPDGTLVDSRPDKGIRRGTWELSDGQLCFNLGGDSGKCRDLMVDGDVYGTANRKGNRFGNRFTDYTDGNTLEPRQANDSLYTGTLSDFHAHVKGGITLAEIVELMDAHGVDATLVMRRDSPRFDIGNAATATDAELLAQRAAFGDRIRLAVPMQVSDWHAQDPMLAGRVSEQAASGHYRLIGEITLLGGRGKAQVPPDSPLFAEVLTIAEDNDLPVMLHHFDDNDRDLAAIRQLLESHPRLTLVWAHFCGYTAPGTLGALLESLPALHCDLAWLHRPERAKGIVDEDHRFVPAWRELIERHPDRFLAGIDMTPPTAYRYNYAYAVRRLRTALGSLSPDTAHQVATGNFHRLLGDRD